MIELRLFESQLDVEQQWRLMEWCRMRGADELSTRILAAREYDAAGEAIQRPDVDPEAMLAPLAEFAPRRLAESDRCSTKTRLLRATHRSGA
jgi:hypothetical protein